MLNASFLKSRQSLHLNIFTYKIFFKLLSCFYVLFISLLVSLGTFGDGVNSKIVSVLSSERRSKVSSLHSPGLKGVSGCERFYLIS